MMPLSRMTNAALLGLFGLAAQVAHSQGALCAYNYTDPATNEVWVWDFSSLSSTDGYTILYPMTSPQGALYSNNLFNLNICADSPTQCIPQGYTPNAATGVVVETWGAVPACTSDAQGKYCQEAPDKRVRGVCCTANCTVLSDSTEALAEPLDVSMLGKGAGDGIILQFPTLQDPNTDRNICERGSPTMAAQYSISCDTSAEFEVVEVLHQGCEFNFVIKSKYGCAKASSKSTTTAAAATTTTTTTTAAPQGPTGMSAGSAFLLILFIAAVLYFGVGALILKVMTQGPWTIPNRTVWIAFGALIGDGIQFIKGGCKKRVAYGGNADPYSSGVNDADYHEPSDSGFGTKATTSGTVDEAYDDL